MVVVLKSKAIVETTYATSIVAVEVCLYIYSEFFFFFLFLVPSIYSLSYIISYIHTPFFVYSFSILPCSLTYIEIHPFSGSHTDTFLSRRRPAFLLRCMSSFFSREGFISGPLSVVDKSNCVYVLTNEKSLTYLL